MGGAIAKAEQILAGTEGAVLAGQFVNPANPAAHRKTTAPEIWTQTGGAVDIFVARRHRRHHYRRGQLPERAEAGCENNGGRAGGVRRAFGRRARPHGLMGIGAGFVPDVLDVSLLDEIVRVTEEAARASARPKACRGHILRRGAARRLADWVKREERRKTASYCVYHRRAVQCPLSCSRVKQF